LPDNYTNILTSDNRRYAYLGNAWTVDVIVEFLKQIKMQDITVLSLFDGISCIQVALEKVGIKTKQVFASEIDKHAIKVTQHNYPNTIQIGDVTKVSYKDGILYTEKGEFNVGKIDLVCGGSPCQGFSFAGKQLNFNDPRSKLFFEFVRLKNEITPQYFLLENVKMKKEYQDVISEQMGVQPILIDSALVSAQTRKRLYWTNIGNGSIDQPEDKGVLLKDILESGVVDKDKSFCIDANYWKGGNLKSYFENSRRQLVFEAKNKKNVVINPDEIFIPRSFYETRNEKGKQMRREIRKLKKTDSTPRTRDCKQYVIQKHQKANCLVTVDSFLNWVIDKDYYCRKLTPIECERLQGINDNFTSMVSNSQRYKLLGNGWQVDTIEHILKHI
jgi:DNA-cytosine methyltransferase